jgi:hypothetical protein
MDNFSVVVYSHSDYSDVLKIQTDYTSKINNKILLINEQFNDKEIISKYNKVIKYDDTQPYSNRLLNLSNIDSEFILFIHDIDIILEYNDDFIDSCISKMKEEKIDRIDLQYYSNDWNPNTKKIDLIYSEKKVQLVRQENLDGFIYNVNPSIWRLNTFINIMSNFLNRTYRDIEFPDVQKYSSQFDIYKLYNDSFLQVGYFKCLEEFIFLHISHTGMFLPKINNDLPENIQRVYDSIIENYLQNSNKNFRLSMHG